MRKRIGFAAGTLLLLLALPVAAPAAAVQTNPDAGELRSPASLGEAMPGDPLHAELPFAHPVSLTSAATIDSAVGLPVVGYRFESDAIAGDFWNAGGLSVRDFLSEVNKVTGTAPEIIAAYVDGASYAARTEQPQRSAPVILGSELPTFDAPDAVVPQAPLSSTSDNVAIRRTMAETWQPRSAQVEIRSMPDNLAITGKYSWWGLDPFAAPFVIADGWGMEFQVDFYTRVPSIDPDFTWTGIRPHCGNPGTVYKDWAAASNRVFTWFAWVIDGTQRVVAPGSIGLYGDYNDLTDPCAVSTIAVGAAAPEAIPATAGSTEELEIYMYPEKGQESTSKIGAIVQPVNRALCEQFPSTPLTDCMGITPGTYPGPGPTGNRMVLNSEKGYRAPELCWNSEEFGSIAATIWPSCGSNGS